MHPTNTRPPAPARPGARPSGRSSGDRRPGDRLLGPRRGRVLALLVVVVCLADLAVAELNKPSSGSAASPSGTAPPGAGTDVQERLAAVSWPEDGVSAADIGGYGLVPGPGATHPVPIASVAKLMTAYVILQDHPLPAGEPGPDITVQPSEAAAYPSQARDGDSLVRVAAGETITERQALEALLLPSADNMAWILARWDAGGQAAFTARMNAAARVLGMTGTSYTDPSGLDSSTTSTAADQVRLGTAAMSLPALAAITAMPTAVVPVAGLVRNTNTLLGQDGIAGLKTGSTQAAGGCVLVAAWNQANGHKTLIVAAAFGQPGTDSTILPNALRAGHDLVLSLDRALSPGSRPGSSPGALSPGSRSGSHDHSEGDNPAGDNPQGPPREPHRPHPGRLALPPARLRPV